MVIVVVVVVVIVVEVVATTAAEVALLLFSELEFVTYTIHHLSSLQLTAPG